MAQLPPEYADSQLYGPAAAPDGINSQLYGPAVPTEYAWRARKIRISWVFKLQNTKILSFMGRLLPQNTQILNKMVQLQTQIT